MRSIRLFFLATAIAGIAGCHENGIQKAIRQTLPATGRESTVLAVYQPWFGSSEHINVGYSSDDAQVIDNQIKKAKEFGISGFVVDWYGNNRKDFDHNYALMQASAAGSDFKVAIMYDEPKGEPEDSTQEAIVALDYAHEHYIADKAENSRAYLRYNGRPIIFIWPNSQRTNWDVVRRHVDQWEVQPILFMRFNSTSYSQDFDGFYAWVDTGAEGWAPDGHNWGKAYLDSFYKAMNSQYPNKIVVTAAWPGFDDSKASWGSHRKIDQRCGKTFQDTMTEFYRNDTPEHPIPFLLIETWNDYEEGTAIERGISHCSAQTTTSKADAKTGSQG